MALRRRGGTGGASNTTINEVINNLANFDLALIRTADGNTNVQGSAIIDPSIERSSLVATDNVEFAALNNGHQAIKFRTGLKYIISSSYYIFLFNNANRSVDLVQYNQLGEVVDDGLVVRIIQGASSPAGTQHAILDLTGELEQVLDGFISLRIRMNANINTNTRMTIKALTLDQNTATGLTSGAASGSALAQEDRDYLDFLMETLIDNAGLEIVTQFGRILPEHLGHLRTILARGIIQPTSAGADAQALLQNIHTLSFGNNEPQIQYIQDGMLFNLNPHFLRNQLQKFKYMQGNLVPDAPGNATAPYELFQRDDDGDFRAIELPLFSTEVPEISIGHLHGIARESATRATVDRPGKYRIQAKVHFIAVKDDSGLAGVRSAFDVILKASRLQPGSNVNRFEFNFLESFDSGYMRGAGGGVHNRADATFDTVVELNQGDEIYFECSRYTPDNSLGEFVYLADDKFSTVILERLHD